MHQLASKESIQCDAFKEVFKYYKQRQPLPNLADVMDVSKTKDPKIIQRKPALPTLPPVTGLKPAAAWKIFGHSEIPGFYFIVNPFMPNYQKYWMKRCLTDYSRKPNPSNLDAHIALPEDESIWENSLRENKDEKGKSLLDKLRWVTLGYHHDWNTKQYSADKRSDFPADLEYLSQYLAMVLGFPLYKAEAAIINFYHLDSTLAGHTDHSELDHESPLLSISFGQTAIFLLGGSTRETKPIAMFINSGDIVVMSKESRLCYHAVPKILKVSEEELLERIEGGGTICTDSPVDIANTDRSMEEQDLNYCDNCNQVPSAKERKTKSSDTLQALGDLRKDKDFPIETVIHAEINSAIEKTMASTTWTSYMEYIKTCRINMNVRQVLRKGQSFPAEATVYMQS